MGTEINMYLERACALLLLFDSCLLLATEKTTFI